MFAEFKEDDRNLYKQMLDHDFKYWKIARVIKIDFDVSAQQVDDPFLSVFLDQKYTVNHSA